jgi:SAM-dependent methyltransferase
VFPRWASWAALTASASSLSAAFRSPPSSSASRVHSTDELLAKAEEFNRNAERYWEEAVKDEASKEKALGRPLRSFDAADVLYRVGLVLHELHAGPGHVVLDFGAGNCWLSALLAKMGCHTISVDVSATAIELGRELFTRENARNAWFQPRFAAYDGHRLPVGEASVDRIVCFDAFHHIPNQSETLGELHRVLRPGGRVVFAEPGEGHQHSDQAAHEVDRFGVLENELDLAQLVQLVRSHGFGGVRLKPYPNPGVLSLSPEDYIDLLNGNERAFPMETMRSNLRLSYILAFDKGAFAADSRAPGSLRCAVEPSDEVLCGPAESVQRVSIRVRNTGDTTWLHRPAAYGGYVRVGGHLYDPAGTLLTPDYLYQHLLPHDVPPGGEVHLVLDVDIPARSGESVLRIDMVDAGVAWFSQAGSPTRDLRLRESDGYHAETTRGFLATFAREAAETAPADAAPGTSLTIPLRVRNSGRLTWPGSAELQRGAITIGGRLLDGEERPSGEVERVMITTAVRPGGEIQVPFPFRVPLTPGRYTLALDLIREGYYWFEKVGSIPLRIGFTVSDRIPDSTDPGLLRADIHCPAEPVRVAPGTDYVVTLRVTNSGNTLWRHSAPGTGFVTAAAHLYTGAGQLVEWDHVHERLPRDVGPAEEIVVALALRAPGQEGAFVLEFDMVDEGIAWFGSTGSETPRRPLQVTGSS